jgi:hypothetical protein
MARPYLGTSIKHACRIDFLFRFCHVAAVVDDTAKQLVLILRMYRVQLFRTYALIHSWVCQVNGCLGVQLNVLSKGRISVESTV